MTINEILNKRIVEHITYGDMLRKSMGEQEYNNKLPQLKQMDCKTFLEYFEEEIAKERTREGE